MTPSETISDRIRKIIHTLNTRINRTKGSKCVTYEAKIRMKARLHALEWMKRRLNGILDEPRSGTDARRDTPVGKA